MKVIQIAPCFVDIYKESGGVANIVRQICIALDRSKIQTVLICSDTELKKKVSNSGIIEFSDYLTIFIVSQNVNPLLGPISNIGHILKSIEDIDLVHIHTCFSAITDFSLNFFVKKGIPCIFTPHGKLSPNMFKSKRLFKQLYFKLFVKKSLQESTRIITSSQNEIEFIKKFGTNSRLSFIYNGYSQIYNDLSYKNKWDLIPKSYILFLGYLEPRKQPDLLIKAFSKSRASKFIKLVLSGPDSYGFRNKLEEIVDLCQLRSDNKVIFTDRVSGDVKWDILKNAIALFLPSKGEGWPVVIAEAIGAKVPIVISKECNFSEVKELRIGIEVADFSDANWTNAIDSIFTENELLEEFTTNLEKHANSFSWEYITNQWINEYGKTIQ